ncbi:MAG: rhodanese-like domain-containing protein [Fusobacteriaceae bacterium]
MKILKKLLIMGATGAVLSTIALAENYKKLSTEEVQKSLKNSETILVDTRISDAFNGWALDGMKKGGHIDGAKDFSAYWLKNSADPKIAEKTLKKTISDKGITPDKNVILYDSNGKDSLEIAKYFEKNGIKNISLYNINEWASSNLPLKKFPGHEIIVPAQWVKNNLNNGYKIFEISWGPEEMDEDYKAGHIPGAVHIDTDEVESPPLWSINSDTDLIKFAKKNGITKDDKVILYATNPMPSYRIGAILKYLGVKDVRILNGGLNSWKRENYPLETKSNPKVAVNDFLSTLPLNKKLIVDIDEAKRVSKDGHLVDIRSWDEHIGKITGYSDLNYKGRPAGAIWGKAGDDELDMREFRNIDNTMRNGDEILKMWKNLGIDPKNELSFFCGTGWRAAEVLIFSKVLGLDKTSLYSNGWYEWSADKKNPVETGKPVKR